VPPLRVPADLVARAHADPLGDGPVLGHLLRERPLRAEGLVRRLRRGAAGETTRSARGVGFSRDARACGCVCSVQPAPPGGVGPAWWRRPVRGVGRRDRWRFWRRSVRRSAATGCGTRKGWELCAMQQCCVLRWGPVALACARRARGRAQPLQKQELRPARAR
jgi:hypothetical protein